MPNSYKSYENRKVKHYSFKSLINYHRSISYIVSPFDRNQMWYPLIYIPSNAKCNKEQ